MTQAATKISWHTNHRAEYTNLLYENGKLDLCNVYKFIFNCVAYTAGNSIESIESIVMPFCT